MKSKSVSARLYIPRILRLFFLLSIGFLAVTSITTCSSNMDPIDWKMPQKETYEYEVSPQGRTIEVMDHSAIHGFTVVIPAGAVSQNTKIYITKYADAPKLPKGLKGTTALELASDEPFLKELIIKFPCFDTPEDTGKMLTAFYWDTSASSWQIAMPEMFRNNLMTVNTKHLGYWRWGEVIPEDVEAENLNSFLDEAYGPKYLERLLEAVEIESASLLDYNNLNYCANQAAIANIFIEISEKSKTRAEDYLELVNLTCKVWSYSPTVNDIFYGFDELIEIHLAYLVGHIVSMGLDLIPYVGGLLSANAAANAEAIYWMRLGNLGKEYICIFSQAESALWLYMGIHFMAETALLGIALAEIKYPCN